MGDQTNIGKQHKHRKQLYKRDWNNITFWARRAWTTWWATWSRHRSHCFLSATSLAFSSSTSDSLALSFLSASTCKKTIICQIHWVHGLHSWGKPTSSSDQTILDFYPKQQICASFGYNTTLQMYDNMYNTY